MDASTVALLVFGGILGLLVLGRCWAVLHDPDPAAAVIQRFGKFLRVANAGLNFKAPWIDNIIAMVDLRSAVFRDHRNQDQGQRVRQDPRQCAVLHHSGRGGERVLPALQPQGADRIVRVQRDSRTRAGHDSGRRFLKQSEIAVDVKTQLEASMQPFGYGISKVLITDVIPDDRVKASMNSINAALRDQEAAKAQVKRNGS